jgi:hypothetical protein
LGNRRATTKREKVQMMKGSEKTLSARQLFGVTLSRLVGLPGIETGRTRFGHCGKIASNYKKK